MSKMVPLFKQISGASNLTWVDYVTAVIGIFLLLIGTYWILYGKTFEGPVSSHKEIQRFAHDSANYP